MGCDIHLYIEHKPAKQEDKYSWRGFGGRINPGRDYHLFTAMADVRNYDRTALFQPRGLPEGISYHARCDNQLYIVESETDGEGTTTRERAERWVQQGISKYTDERKNFVTHPDWHSHSWLTPDEFETCINSIEDVDSPYKAVLAVMRSFEAQGERARIVFWFDN
jgi:hypothetical protein